MIYYKFDELFKKSGLSYRALSKKTGIGFVTLHKLAKARTCRDYDVCASTVGVICNYFKTKPGDLLVWKK